MFVNPAAPRPISAGIHPELESMPSTASTLKLEKVAPPISGSLMSAPSMAKVASTPRWPLIANWAVKLVAPLASVMVPAASSRSELKSRLFKGSSLTAWLDSSSPPVATACSLRAETVSSPRLESVSTTAGAPGARSIGWLYSILRPSASTVSRYRPEGRAARWNWPSAAVVAAAESFAERRTLAAGMGAPAEFFRTPCQGEIAAC